MRRKLWEAIQVEFKEELVEWQEIYRTPRNIHGQPRGRACCTKKQLWKTREHVWNTQEVFVDRCFREHDEVLMEF